MLDNTSSSSKLISFVFIIFCAEIVLMGPGNWTASFGFSIRKILFTMMGSLFLFDYIFLTRKVYASYIVAFFLGVIFFLFWGLLIPTVRNLNLNYSISDFRPLAGWLLLPFMVSFYRKTNSWPRDRNYIYFFLMLLSLFHIVVWVLGTLSHDLGYATIRFLQGVLEPGLNPKQTGISFHYTSDGSFRTQWGPSCLLILAIYFSVMDFIKNKDKKSVVFLFICLFALYTTESRGMLLSLVLGMSMFPLVWLLFPKKKLDIKYYIIGLSIISLIPLFIIPWFSPEILNALDLTREGSDALRYLQIMPLLVNWSNHLMFGSGFGSTISIVRSEATPYAFEISILALYMKIGILGIVCAIFILSYFLSRVTYGSVYFIDKYKLIFIYIFVFIYFIASNTNPYLSNFFGMFVFYCFVLELSSSNNPRT